MRRAAAVRTSWRAAALAVVLAGFGLEHGCRASGDPEPAEPLYHADASAAGAPVAPGPITLVTYNVHSLVGTDGRFDVDRIAGVIRETGADIVALEECGDFRGEIPPGAPERLADALDLPMAFATTVEVGGRRFGNAVLARFPVRAARKYDLSAGGLLEPRKALRVDLEVAPGVTLAVVCVHIGLYPLERGAQVRAVGRRVLRGIAGPAVLCGDFNHWLPGRDGAIERAGFADVARSLDAEETSFPSGHPMLRLDRVYVNAGVRPLGVHVHRSDASARASDHLPLVCKFDIAQRKL
jgi:endonuclease/exonuclease/phosphatase family metal-dependent hydrolase